MERIIELAGDTSQDTLNSVTIGDRTCGFMRSQTKLGDREKDLIIDEAAKILGRCIPPGVRGNVTNIRCGVCTKWENSIIHHTHGIGCG